MGAFFTNVQLRRGPYTSVETIEMALDALAAEEGLERGDPDAPAYDRTIVVRLGPGDWISVYDEVTELQYTTDLDLLAAILAGATHSTCVSVLVHDSDVLLTGLFVDGKKVDEYCSDPMYMEGSIPTDMLPTPEQVAAVVGNPARWKHLLVPGATPEKLDDVWRNKADSAEDRLAQVAELLGWSMDRVRVGLNYFEFGEVPSVELLILPYVLANRGNTKVPYLN
ncbi:MAG TPA: hypothetical protein PK156_29880 [Polyangium sp.]|nr:hypothetical protein [Polyangium sp.]